MRKKRFVKFKKLLFTSIFTFLVGFFTVSTVLAVGDLNTLLNFNPDPTQCQNLLDVFKWYASGLEKSDTTLVTASCDRKSFFSTQVGWKLKENISCGDVNKNDYVFNKTFKAYRATKTQLNSYIASKCTQQIFTQAANGMTALQENECYFDTEDSSHNVFDCNNKNEHRDLPVTDEDCNTRHYDYQALLDINNSGHKISHAFLEACKCAAFCGEPAWGGDSDACYANTGCPTPTLAPPTDTPAPTPIPPTNTPKPTPTLTSAPSVTQIPTPPTATDTPVPSATPPAATPTQSAEDIKCKFLYWDSSSETVDNGQKGSEVYCYDKDNRCRKHQLLCDLSNYQGGEEIVQTKWKCWLKDDAQRQCEQYATSQVTLTPTSTPAETAQSCKGGWWDEARGKTVYCSDFTDASSCWSNGQFSGHSCVWVGGNRGCVCGGTTSEGSCDWCVNESDGWEKRVACNGLGTEADGVNRDPSHDSACSGGKVCYSCPGGSGGGNSCHGSRKQNKKTYIWDTNSNSCSLLRSDDTVGCGSCTPSDNCTPDGGKKVTCGSCYCDESGGGHGGGGNPNPTDTPTPTHRTPTEADFTTWLDTFVKYGRSTNADWTGDGRVNLNDYFAIYQTLSGNTCPPDC